MNINKGVVANAATPLNFYKFRVYLKRYGGREFK